MKLSSALTQCDAKWLFDLAGHILEKLQSTECSLIIHCSSTGFFWHLIAFNLVRQSDRKELDI